jgi:hypothetical protein
MASARVGATATPVAGGRILVVGGDAAAGPGTEVYDPARGTFCVGAPLRWGRHGHAAAVLPGEEALVVGGAPEACAEIYGGPALACGPPPGVAFTQVQSISPIQAPPLRRNADAEALVAVTSSQPAHYPREICVLAQAEGACGQAQILDCNSPSAVKVFFHVGPTAFGTCRLRFVARDAACNLGIGTIDVPVQ